MKILCLCFILPFLFSCATYSSGYIPNVSLNIEQINVPKEQRKDITFSMSYYEQVGDKQFYDYSTMTSKIREYLSETNLFNKIHYVSTIAEKSKYHLHFDVKITGTSIENQNNYGAIWGATLGIFPMWIYFNKDTSMFVFSDDKEIYSITAPEKIKDVMWLPFIFLSPFFNHGTVNMYVRRKTLRYFMNEIIENKLYLFNEG